MEKEGYAFFPAPAKIDLGYLIEDWQALITAIDNGDWESVQAVADCIAALIQWSAQTTPDLLYQPSTSSLIVPGRTGVLAKPDGTDFTCAGGLAMHEVMCSANCQCTKACMTAHGCNPERAKILLGDSKLLEFLEKAK